MTRELKNSKYSHKVLVYLINENSIQEEDDLVLNTDLDGGIAIPVTVGHVNSSGFLIKSYDDVSRVSMEVKDHLCRIYGRQS